MSSTIKFKHNKVFNFPEISEKYIDGKRHYITPKGKVYPSVTTVLGSQNKPYLTEWIKKVGEKEAEKIKNDAAFRGTSMHNMVEKYVNGELDLKKELPFMIQLFLPVQKFLDKAIEEIWANEEAVYSDSLMVAGRTDMIAVIKGIPCIVDFKTSIKSKNKDWIKDYYMQTACYAECFREMSGISIKKSCIIISNENGAVGKSALPDVFWSNVSDHLEDFKAVRSSCLL